jgi:hypothetical protein
VRMCVCACACRKVRLLFYFLISEIDRVKDAKHVNRRSFCFFTTLSAIGDNIHMYCYLNGYDQDAIVNALVEAIHNLR